MIVTNIFTIIGVVGGGLLTLAAVAALVGVAVSQYRKGSREEKTDVVSSAEKLTNFWKEQSEGYKIMMEEKDKRYQEQINELTKQVGELRGQLNEKVAQAERYEKIFQGRNPEQEAFMKTMLAVAQQSQTFMEAQGKRDEMIQLSLQEIASFMKTINQHLEEDKKKEVKLEGVLTKKN